jgi:hypothetical protein
MGRYFWDMQTQRHPNTRPAHLPYAVGDLVKANWFCGVVLEVATTARHFDAEFGTTHHVPLRNPLFRVRFNTRRQHRWVAEGTAQVWFYPDQDTYWLFPDELNLVCRASDINRDTLAQFLGLADAPPVDRAA